jgi:hypothetical protein
MGEDCGAGHRQTKSVQQPGKPVGAVNQQEDKATHVFCKNKNR